MNLAEVFTVANFIQYLLSIYGYNRMSFLIIIVTLVFVVVVVVVVVVGISVRFGSVQLKAFNRRQL